MLTRRATWSRASVVVIAALAFAAGCAASAPVAAPRISAASETAASELAVHDLLPAFEWPDATTAPAPASTVATTKPVEVSPSTTIGVAEAEAVAEAVLGDPRGAEAMALIAFAWRETLPGWSIAFLPAKAGLRGLTRVDDRRIEIYVRDSDSAASLARVVAHELGHAIDVELNSPGDRERWRAVRGVSPSVRWWPDNAVSDFDTLAGDFAEAFATLLTGSVSLSRVAPAPGPDALAVLAELAAR
ncbi:MAG TPA: hypothetical protein VM282_04455 [Acidimicrobiales bacterium]|nr:hypothetical protein [Acidimicrobiales bacterium]